MESVDTPVVFTCETLQEFRARQRKQQKSYRTTVLKRLQKQEKQQLDIAASQLRLQRQELKVQQQELILQRAQLRRTGLSATTAVSATGPTFLRIFTSDQCMICFTTDGEKFATSCGHVCHKSCIEDWFKHPLGSVTCPSCRSSLR